MKKKYVLFSATVCLAYLALTSYNTGPALFGLNRTGAQASTTTCNGSGCHGTGSSTTVALTLDSGSVSTTHYKPGNTYTLKIHGVNTSGNPQFGFECVTVSGSGSSQVQAGSFSGLPSSTGVDAFSGLSILEHHAPLTGSPAGTYDESVTWTAPSTNVGNVTIYCTLNAVNGDGLADAADISGNTNLALTPVNTTAIPENQNSQFITFYPNPVTDHATLSISGAEPGTYSVFAMNVAGGKVYENKIEITGRALNTDLPAATWSPGIYQVVVSGAGARQVLTLIKQ